MTSSIAMKFSILILVLPLILLGACRNSDRDYDDSLLASTDAIAAEMFLSHTFLIIDDAAKKEYGMIPNHTSGHLSCATIISNLLGSPNTINIDFGSGCVGADGRERKGTIYCTVNGNYGDSLVVTTVNFINYYINDIKIEGSVQFTHKGTNDAGNPVINYSFSNLKAHHYTPDWTATVTGSGKRELISDISAFDLKDDVYSITGTITGRSRTGNYFDAEITEALIHDFSCNYIGQGKMEITPDNLIPRYVDFGDAVCDTNVIVVISETQHLVILD